LVTVTATTNRENKREKKRKHGTITLPNAPVSNQQKHERARPNRSETRPGASANRAYPHPAQRHAKNRHNTMQSRVEQKKKGVGTRIRTLPATPRPSSA
jgi:hypothetical protein